MPGKFEGNADEKLAERLYEEVGSGAVDEIGDVQELGWYAKVPNFEGKNYIVEEDNYGFFTYREYERGDSAFVNDWRSVNEEYDRFYQAQGEVDEEGLQEGAIVEEPPAGVPAVIGEAGPEAVIPLDDPEAVETMAEAIEEGGGGTNANDATVAAAEAVEAAAEAVETTAEADAVEAVADAAGEVAEAQADAVEEVAEAAEETKHEEADVVKEVVKEEPDRAPEAVHGFFR